MYRTVALIARMLRQCVQLQSLASSGSILTSNRAPLSTSNRSNTANIEDGPDLGDFIQGSITKVLCTFFPQYTERTNYFNEHYGLLHLFFL